MMIRSTRLRAEPIQSTHAAVLYPLLLDEQIYTYLPENAPISLASLEERYEFLSAGTSPDGREHWLNWVLFEEETDAAIGYLQATVASEFASIAYVLNPAYWGKGYATEAVKAMIDYLFSSFDIASIRAEINPENSHSIRLIERLGFRFLRHDADEQDDIYQLLRES